MRILDRFQFTGRKLTQAEKDAVDKMNAKYPNVPFISKPPRLNSKPVAISNKC